MVVVPDVKLTVAAEGHEVKAANVYLMVEAAGVQLRDAAGQHGR